MSTDIRVCGGASARHLSFVCKKSTYLYLSNIAEGNDFIIRKLNPKNEEEMIPLKDEEEVQKAILLLTNKQLEI